jgi:hypothetical protein
MTGVSPVTNKKHLVTQINVSFSDAVNAGEADSLATYRLATAGKKGSFTAKNAKVIKLRSALYNAATHTVTLTPLKAFSLSKPVQLVVYGVPPSGLQDSLGRFIDGGHNGRPGGNAVAVLSRGGATLSAISDHSTAVRRFRLALLTPAAVDLLLEREGAIAVKHSARAEPPFRDDTATNQRRATRDESVPRMAQIRVRSLAQQSADRFRSLIRGQGIAVFRRSTDV